MAETVLETVVDTEQVEALLRTAAGKASRLRVESARLRHHPFAGFVFEVPRLRPRRVHALVDYYSGKAFLSGPWLTRAADPEEIDAVPDPRWNSIDFQEARTRARALVGTAALRRVRLHWDGAAYERSSVRTVWKPNWIVEATTRSGPLRVLVDGVNGRYFVIGS